MYSYLIENSTGQILVRSSGPLGNDEPTIKTLVKWATVVEPATHVWDFRLSAFQKVPSSVIAARARAGLKKIAERKAALKRAAEAFLTLDPTLQTVLEAILVSPDNELYAEIQAARGEKKS